MLRDRKVEELVLIQPGKHTVFDRRFNPAYYLTVYTGNSSALCANKEVATNRSVIVTPDCQVFESYYRTMFQTGKSDIWKDCYGNNFHHCKQ